MSYNREWDQGKDWDDRGYRGYTRGREDDEYYNEGKRRKYNNGGYEEAQWSSYDNPDDRSVYDHSQGYHGNYNGYDYPDNYNNFGQENTHYEDYGHRGGPNRRDFIDHGERGGHEFNDHRKRHVASEPSPHVIFLGLDMDFTEADLQSFLKGQNFTIETVTIIRDRNTGQSKGFGFAQFRTTEEARAFVDPNFPFISVPPPASHGASATAAFKKAMESGDRMAGKRVKIDYSQSAGGAGHGRRGPHFSNDGTRDIGNTQSAILLFRGLDPLSGPAAVAQAMQNSAGPGKEGAKGMKRVILIKDKQTMASWGYTFVEFIDVQSASAVLANTMSPQLHPNGFRISDRPVAASFAHPYSFQPVTDEFYRDDSCIPSSLNLGGVECTFVKYWDESSMVAVMDFKVEESKQPQTNIAKEKDKKEKKPKRPIDKGPAGPSTLPVSNKPVTLSFNKLGAASKAASSTAPAASQAARLFSVPDEHEEEEIADGGNRAAKAATNAEEDEKSKQAPKVIPLVASKKTVNNITKWNQVQEELSTGIAPTPIPAPVAIAAAPVDAKVKERTATPDEEPEFEFSNTTSLTCLLCARQFKSLDQLKRHNKESDLHKKNYKDANLREIAREKARKARGTSPADKSQTPQYRDRASERRTLFNQPDVPVPESSVKGGSNGNSKRRADGPPPAPSPPPQPAVPAKDDANIGNKLLKMMGWTEGSGLGTDGEGRVDPIQTAIYASGAGLGASKGKEVGKYQDGYTGYVQMAKEVARERYGS